jgi:hypothetical protein
MKAILKLLQYSLITTLTIVGLYFMLDLQYDSFNRADMQVREILTLTVVSILLGMLAIWVVIAGFKMSEEQVT